MGRSRFCFEILSVRPMYLLDGYVDRSVFLNRSLQVFGQRGYGILCMDYPPRDPSRNAQLQESYRTWEDAAANFKALLQGRRV